MQNFLDFFGFVEPNVVEFEDQKNNLKVLYNNDKSEACLFSGEERWLTYSPKYKESLWEVFSHYWIADGVCICTGLGFALRESWILSKKNVSKVVVLEKSKELIEYHKKFNSQIFDELEVINVDANEYKGKCDTLLLDHYETETWDEIAKYSRNILKNIICEKMWIWPLEHQLIVGYINSEENESFQQIYNTIKLKYGLTKLPELREEELRLFVFSFFRGLNLSWSADDIDNHKKKITSEWYKSWNDKKLHVHPETFC